MSSLNKELFGSDDEDEAENDLSDVGHISEQDEEDMDFAGEDGSQSPSLAATPSYDITDPALHIPFFDSANLHLFPSIPGLVLLRLALTHSQQSAVINGIIDGGYFAVPGQNQSMHFGRLPPHVAWLEGWTLEVHRRLEAEGKSGLFPWDVLERRPVFDQAIVNLYKRGEGIKSHVDLARFSDGILVLSFLSSCVMTMRPATAASRIATSYVTTTPSFLPSGTTIPIFLRPGDALAMSGPARYDWEHGIEEREFDVLEDGERYERRGRLSVTLRRIKEWEEGGKTTEEGNEGWVEKGSRA